MERVYDSNYVKLRDEVKELRAQDKVLKTIFENAFECIVMVDSRGYITMMNETYAEFLNIEPKQAIGRHVADVIENTRLHIVVETGQAEMDQIQEIRGYDAVTARIPIINNGEIVGAIGKVIYKDVKEVRELFKKLEAATMELDLYKERLRRVQGDYFSLDNIIGDNTKIQELKRTIMRVANSDSTVLITGESGTGKEVFANAIHETSNRRDNNFVKINCAAIPENILESELFGYEDGSFTGARRGGKIGKFELADHGTILLDEIGDMGFDMQAKILRVLQEKEVEKIGGNETKQIDVRIIAATNQNLVEKIQKGEFRRDLFYRLNVINLELPPLRQRADDIPLLCDFFIKKYNDKFGVYIEDIEDEAMDYLKKYNWPGNIRELENIIERAYNFIDGNIIGKKHLPKRILNNSEPRFHGDLRETLDRVEKKLIIQALKSTEGNKSKAARILGINRASLYQKLEKYEIADS